MLEFEGTKTLDDLEEFLKKPEIQELTEEMRRSFQFVLAGNTPRHIEYQEKALDEILAETGGRKVPQMSDPSIQRLVFVYLIKLDRKNTNFTLSGGFHESFGHTGTPDSVVASVEVAAELKRRHIAKGGIVDDGGDATMGPVDSDGGGLGCHLTEFLMYDPHDAESVKSAREYMIDSVRVSKGKGWGPGAGARRNPVLPDEERQRIFLASEQPAAYRWQRKIKQAFDPNDVGDRGYMYLDERPANVQ